MQARAPLDVVVPVVHRKVCSLQGSESALLQASEVGVPTDPIVRAALRAGVDHTIETLETLRRALDAARRKLAHDDGSHAPVAR